MVVAHNLQAMNTARQFGINTKQSSKLAEKLSSGYKINRAADDAAGLSISEKMRKQIRGLTQASLNAEDGISMVQIADGAMAEIHDMLDRGLELSVQAANGTLAMSDKKAIQREIEHLKKEIDGIRERTKFNEIYVLKGKEIDTGEIEKVANAGNGLPDTVELSDAFYEGFLTDTYTTKEQYKPDASAALIKDGYITHPAASIDFSLSPISDLVGTGFYVTCCTCDAYYSIEFVEGTTNSIEMFDENQIFKIGIDGISNGKDLIDQIKAGTHDGKPNDHFTMFAHDADNANKLIIYDMRRVKGTPYPEDWDDTDSEWVKYDREFTEDVETNPLGMVGQGVMVESNKPIYREESRPISLQIGADSDNKMKINLPYISCKTLAIDKVNVCKTGGADEAIDSFSKAKEKVSEHRSRMGAYQNRLEHTVKNLDNVVENTTAAESQIRDTDMAKTMVSYSTVNILIQAGQSMLSQANQMNQGVLSLIA